MTMDEMVFKKSPRQHPLLSLPSQQEESEYVIDPPTTTLKTHEETNIWIENNCFFSIISFLLRSHGTGV